MSPLARRWAPPGAALLLCAAHFATFDVLTRPIVTDVRFFLYFAWRISEGAVPHLDYFENKTQLASFAGAFFYALGEGLDVDPLLAIRIGYLGLAGAGGLLAFQVFRRLGEGRAIAGLLGTLSYCSFGLLGALPAIGNVPKLLMALAAPLAALLALRRRWFWAGSVAALAFLDWQLGVLVWLGVALAAAHGPGRIRSLAAVAAGGAAGLAPMILYLGLHGALDEAWAQVFTSSLVRGAELAKGAGLAERFAQIRSVVALDCPEQGFLVAVAWLGVPVALVWTWRRRDGDHWRLLAPLLVYHLGIASFSLVDFQLHGDLFALLHSAVFFLAVLWVSIYDLLAPRASSSRARLAVAAMLLSLAALLGRPSLLRPHLALANPFARPAASLDDQRELAASVAERLDGGRPAFLEYAELLFLMRRENALPVVYWNTASWAYFREDPAEDEATTALRLLAKAEARVFALPPQLVKDPRVQASFRFEPLLSAGRRYGVMLASRLAESQRLADGAASGASGVAPERIDQLRALGYVDVASTDPALPDGVLRRDPARSDDGLLYLTSAHDCSSHLLEADGEVLRRWAHSPCFRWDNTVLLENGHVLAIHRYPVAGASPDDDADGERALLEFDYEGRLLWERRLPVHHDLEVTPDGRIAALTMTPRRIPEMAPQAWIRDHAVTLLSRQGEPLEEASLADVLRSAPHIFSPRPVQPVRRAGRLEIDLFHSNSVEFMRDPGLAARDPIYALGNVVVALRHQDAVVIFSFAEKRLLWAWGPGEILGPHDVTVLGSGNLLIFDNGLGRGWSRVIEFDPIARRIVWEWRESPPERFYTMSRGASQRLRNGNTLITDSGSAMVFEVTPTGEKVFAFRNPSRSAEGQPLAIVRARRLREIGEGVRRFERSD